MPGASAPAKPVDDGNPDGARPRRQLSRSSAATTRRSSSEQRGFARAWDLSNGTLGQSGLASLDVNSLGTGVSGPTGGKLDRLRFQPILQRRPEYQHARPSDPDSFASNAGDDHTLPGASPPTNLSTSATLTVLDHAVGSATVTSGNGFLVHAGTTVLSATVSLGNAAGKRSDLQVDSAPTIGNGALSSGPASPYYVSPGAAGLHGHFRRRQHARRVQRYGHLRVRGRQAVSPGANSLGSLSVSITGNVYSGKAEWNAASGAWTTNANWQDTVGGGPSGPPGWRAMPPTPRPSARCSAAVHCVRESRTGPPPCSATSSSATPMPAMRSLQGTGPRD